jgi:hypothetical protein
MSQLLNVRRSSELVGGIGKEMGSVTNHSSSLGPSSAVCPTCCLSSNIFERVGDVSDEQTTEESRHSGENKVREEEFTVDGEIELTVEEFDGVFPRYALDTIFQCFIFQCFQRFLPGYLPILGKDLCRSGGFEPILFSSGSGPVEHLLQPLQILVRLYRQ